MPKRFYGQRKDSHVKFPFVEYSLKERISHFVMPTNVSYASLTGKTLNQGEYGTCVVHSTTKFLELMAFKHDGIYVYPSRSAFYAQAQRELYTPPGQEPGDNGLETGDCLKMSLEHGLVYESVRPYPPNGEPQVLLAPVDPSLWNKSYQVRSYAAVEPSVQGLRKALYSKGPVIVGGPFANEWASATNQDGSLPVPQSLDGGHSFLAVGYSDTHISVMDADGSTYKGAILFLNSWGDTYGIAPEYGADGGFFWMPYDWFTIAGGQFAIQDAYTAVAP